MKLSIVASDILGVSGRAVLAALIEGERDPETLAELAKASLRNKHDALVESLTGRFDDHHALLCQIILRRIDELTAVIEEVTGRIDTELALFHDAVEHLVTIPGVDRRAAAVIMAETGADMSRFPSAGHLASWAGVCPGSHESGGIGKSGKTRDGNKSLGSAPPAFPSGAAGLVSTAADFLAFAQMLLRGGDLVLSRPSVETMTTDQLTPEQKTVSGFFPGDFDARGWGFGVAIVTRRHHPAAPVGQYGWDGGLGTIRRNDPSEKMVTMLLTNAAWT